MPERTLLHDGDTWRILSTGSWDDGRVYCHVASTTRSCPERNGPRPVMIAVWVEETEVEAILDRPRGFYRWNRALQGAYLRGRQDTKRRNPLCPYPDRRGHNGKLTWSRAFRAAWDQGYSDGLTSRPEEAPDE